MIVQRNLGRVDQTQLWLSAPDQQLGVMPVGLAARD
jgi:hypothetical protein